MSSSKKLRYLTIDDRQMMQRAMVENQLWTSCLNCESWDKKAEVCTLNGVNARPPAVVIVLGGPCWQFELPF